MEDNIKNFNLPACAPETGLVKAEKTTLPSKDVLSDLTCRKLIKEAMAMLPKAYAPYSNFKVGCALMGKSKKIYTGCNVENAAYPMTNCAERTAFFKAVSEGEQEFYAIAIVGGKDGIVRDYCPPCGACRQVMAEFCNPDKFYIILAISEEDYWTYTLSDLFPLSFSNKNMEK